SISTEAPSATPSSEPTCSPSYVPTPVSCPAELRAVAAFECPVEYDIENCATASLQVGDLCEGDGECGTSDINNCEADSDIYVVVIKYYSPTYAPTTSYVHCRYRLLAHYRAPRRPRSVVFFFTSRLRAQDLVSIVLRSHTLAHDVWTHGASDLRADDDADGDATHTRANDVWTHDDSDLRADHRADGDATYALANDVWTHGASNLRADHRADGDATYALANDIWTHGASNLRADDDADTDATYALANDIWTHNGPNLRADDDADTDATSSDFTNYRSIRESHNGSHLRAHPVPYDFDAADGHADAHCADHGHAHRELVVVQARRPREGLFLGCRMPTPCPSTFTPTEMTCPLLVAITNASDCPTAANASSLPICDSVHQLQVGDYCLGDGHCNTDTLIDNCGTNDVYVVRAVTLEPTNMPSLSSTPTPRPSDTMFPTEMTCPLLVAITNASDCPTAANASSLPICDSVHLLQVGDYCLGDGHCNTDTLIDNVVSPSRVSNVSWSIFSTATTRGRRALVAASTTILSSSIEFAMSEILVESLVDDDDDDGSLVDVVATMLANASSSGALGAALNATNSTELADAFLAENTASSAASNTIVVGVATVAPSTSVPSFEPSMLPTPKRSVSSPTSKPTAVPKPVPTSVPTTSSPSISPTSLPPTTGTPSKVPTLGPSKRPTPNPSTARPTPTRSTPKPTSAPTVSLPPTLSGGGKKKKSDDDGLGAGVITAIVVGIVAFLLCVAVALYVLKNKSDEKKRDTYDGPKSSIDDAAYNPASGYDDDDDKTWTDSRRGDKTSDVEMVRDRDRYDDYSKDEAVTPFHARGEHYGDEDDPMVDDDEYDDPNDPHQARNPIKSQADYDDEDDDEDEYQPAVIPDDEADLEADLDQELVPVDGYDGGGYDDNKRNNDRSDSF
ncbi:hypothetical protein CTAYLR_005468, partial [Chrysophaeum taylorii]